MKKMIILAAGMIAAVVSATAEPGVGMYVQPPSKRGYTIKAIQESGERGGLLMLANSNFTAAANKEMGDAMELWNSHRWKEAVVAFQKIWKQDPGSPWAAEAELHEACYRKFNSEFDDAEDRFVSVLNKYPNNTEVRRKVLRYLPHLYAMSGRMDAAVDVHELMRDQPLTWQEEQHLENYARVFKQALRKDDDERLCGTKALALTLASQNKKGEALKNTSMEGVYKRFEWSRRKASHAAGFSVQELSELSSGTPVQTDLDTLKDAAQPGNPVLVYLKTPGDPKCFSALRKSARTNQKPRTGHFLVVEQVSDSSVEVLDPDGGRSRWALQQFLYRWSGVALVLPGQKNLRGQAIGRTLAAGMRGGCCGSPPPPPSDEDEKDKDKPCKTCPDDDCKGAPGYSFGQISGNFRLADIPIWYPDAKGPTMKIKLKYSRLETSRMAQYSGVNYYPFGNKWHFNYTSYLTETPDTGIDIVLPGGSVEHYNKVGSNYQPADVWNKNSVYRSNQWFVLTLDESEEQWFYNTNTAVQQHLEKFADKYGNTVNLQYDSGNGRLTNMVDAVGRKLQFRYNASGYITNITDSTARAAIFSYNGSQDLISLTDMGGLTTTIKYDEHHWPTNITYPSGQSWAVNFVPGSWQYGVGMSVFVTDPLRQTNSLFTSGAGANDRVPIIVKDKTGNSWGHAGAEISNNKHVIYYDLVNAIATNVPGYGSEYRIEGDQWEYREYDANGNVVSEATAKTPYHTAIGWVDGRGTWTASRTIQKTYDSDYNVLSTSLLTNSAGGNQLVGTWTNGYDARGNRIAARDARSQLTRYGYSAKNELIAVTNALNGVTLFRYDGNGNRTNMIDALGRTNRYEYTANGQLYKIIRPTGGSVDHAYDSVGRLQTRSVASGSTANFYYDKLDRLTDAVDSFGRTNHFEYGCCGIDWSRNRLNRITVFGHDELGRTTSITDPESRLTEFSYNGADQIAKLTAYVGGQPRVKKFDYTSTNGFSRLTQASSPMGKLARFDYTFRGGLAWRQDGNGKVTKYQYDAQERLVSVTDENNNARLTLDYDVLDQVTRSASSNSVYDFKYDALNRVTNTVCELKNIPGYSTVKYRIDYAYDAVGNVTNRVITGIQGMTESITTRYLYDSGNRVTNIIQLTNSGIAASAWYEFDQAGRLFKTGYGNNDLVTRRYDNENKLVHLGITNGVTAVQWYGYQRDAEGNITAITNNGNVTFYKGDAVGWLTNEVSSTETNSWVYDEAGNWLRVPLASSKLVYNPDDELIARAGINDTSWAATVTGVLNAGPKSNKWFHSTAECRGIQAAVSQVNGTFSLPNVPLYGGENKLSVTVTDVSGNQSTQVRTVYKSLTNSLESFYYDGNGNLTNWVNGSQNWVYEWDWAGRLTKVRSNNVAVLENWYEASNQRIAKQEVLNGQTNRCLYLSDGWSIIGIMNKDGQVLETFTRGIGLEGDVGTLVAVTHHAGSTANGTFYTHNNHRGDTILTRSGTTTTGTYNYSAFGLLKSKTGSDICRFKFSGKERDESCELSYFGFRFYSPQWQRWLSRDPMGEEGGLNLYAAMDNRPIDEIDPFGLRSGITGPFNGFWKRNGGGLAGLFGAAAGYLGGKIMDGCKKKCKRGECESCCAKGAAVGGAGALIGAVVGCVGTSGLGCGLAIGGAALAGLSLADDYKECMDDCATKKE